MHIFDKSPMFHAKLKKPEIEFMDNGEVHICSVTDKIYAAMIDRHETAIYDAIIKGAEECGITDAYLLDKEFIVAAIKEKMERRDGTCACDRCRGVKYTDNPFSVTTQMGLEVKAVFNFCPVCGRELRPDGDSNCQT